MNKRSVTSNRDYNLTLIIEIDFAMRVREEDVCGPYGFGLACGGHLLVSDLIYDLFKSSQDRTSN